MNTVNVKWVSLFLCLIPVLVLAQHPMSQGFALLENNQYQEAETFFVGILDSDPQNKTARICYGRAMGLGGNTQPAYEIFTHLEKDYPGDMEVLLNLAESLMWAKSFEEASGLYTNLLIQDSLNFTALLGNANAYAARKKYLPALDLIGRALAVDPTNASARVSRKFILLGAADQQKNQKNYTQSHFFLNHLLEDFPQDKDVRLFESGLYLVEQNYEKAQETYQVLLNEELDPYQAYLGLSYTSILQNKKKMALVYADQALDFFQTQKEETSLPTAAYVSRINALGALRKFKEAFQYIDSLESQIEPQVFLDMAKARMNVWQGNFEKGLKEYTELTSQHGPTFDLQMGMVESLRALHQADLALAELDSALLLMPNHPDAQRLKNQMKLADRPSLKVGATYLIDSGTNQALDEEVEFQFSRMGSFRPIIYMQNRNVGQPLSENGNSQIQVMGGSKWRIHPRVEMTLMAGATSYEAEASSRKFAPMGKLSIKANPGKYHHLEFQVVQDIHNYTASLTQLGIRRTDWVGSYNFSLPSSFGMYAQYRRTYQSDQNLRNLLFTSFYYDVLDVPLVKVGVNFSLFGFARKEPLLYFSPEVSKSGEVFAQVGKQSNKPKTFSYHVLMALGQQKIETNLSQMTYRGEVKIAYQCSDQLQFKFSLSGGNSVQTSIQGYSSLTGGLEMNYRFPSKNPE